MPPCLHNMLRPQDSDDTNSITMIPSHAAHPSPLCLFMFNLLRDQVGREGATRELPTIVMDNARITPRSRTSTSMIGSHSTHRWECVEPSPTLSSKLRKSNKTITLPSTAPVSSKNNNRSSTNVDTKTAAATASIAPPGRPSSAGALPPLRASYPGSQPVPMMLSSSTMPACPIRRLSEEDQQRRANDDKYRMTTGGAPASTFSPDGSNTHATRSPPSSYPYRNPALLASTISTDPLETSYSPLRRLSPTKHLTRNLSQTLARFTSNLSEQTSPVVSRLLSRTLEGRRLSGTFAIQAMDPPSQPQRKPSKQIDYGHGSFCSMDGSATSFVSYASSTSHSIDDQSPILPQHKASITSLASVSSTTSQALSLLSRPSMIRQQAILVGDTKAIIGRGSSSSMAVSDASSQAVLTPTDFATLDDAHYSSPPGVGLSAVASTNVVLPYPTSDLKQHRSTTPPRAVARPRNMLLQRLNTHLG
jgi:hypothetical protein